MKLIFCLSVGLLFALRIRHWMVNLGYQSIKSAKIFAMVLLAVTILARSIESTEPFLLWMVAIVVFLIPKIALVGIERKRRQQFRNETLRFFDRLLMGVRSGTSAREVLRLISTDGSFGFHTRDLAAASLHEDARLFETANPTFRSRLIELRRILRSGQRTAERVQAMRRTLVMKERFQRKSRLATQPIRAQMWIVVSLYVGLLLLQCSFDSKVLGSVWMWASAGLLIAGILIIEMLRRSFKWKI